MIAIRRPVNVDRLADERAQQRQRQEPVRDRRLERRLGRRARRVDVDPLVIAGRVGELIDALLRDLEPVADGDLLADAVASVRTSMSIMSIRQLESSA